MGSFNIQKIEKLKARKNVKGLIKALGYPEDLRVRTKAAEALGQISDKRAVEPLIAAFKDEIQDVRDAATEALGKIDAPVVEPLIAALRDNDSDTRKYAAETLGKIGDARAVEPLIAVLRDEDSTSAQKAVAQALGEIGDACAVEPLIAVLKDKDKNVRKAAAGALPMIGDERAVEPLIAVLKDKEWNVRSAAAIALGEMGDARAVEPLIAALNDKKNKSTLRKVVAEALGKIGAPSVESLIIVLKDADEFIREYAAETLGKIGDARAVEPLIEALRDKNRNVRKAAAAGLKKLKWQPDKGINGAAYWIAQKKWGRCVDIGTPALELLIATLRDEDASVRSAAVKSLDQLGWQPDKGIDGAAYWVARKEFHRCIEIGARAVEPLIAALEDESKYVRMTAAEALGEIGDDRAVEPLITALSDVRSSAVVALGKIGDDRAVEPLIALLVDYKVKDETRRAAARSLVRLYMSGRLNDHQKQTILSMRSTIVGTSKYHEDGHADMDIDGDKGCFGAHADLPADIVKFPL